MKNHDPRRGLMSMVFLPIHPSPARCANSRSGTGPASTNVRVEVPSPPKSSMKLASCSNGLASVS